MPDQILPGAMRASWALIDILPRAVLARLHMSAKDIAFAIQLKSGLAEAVEALERIVAGYENPKRDGSPSAGEIAKAALAKIKEAR